MHYLTEERPSDYNLVRNEKGTPLVYMSRPQAEHAAKKRGGTPIAFIRGGGWYLTTGKRP